MREWRYSSKRHWCKMLLPDKPKIVWEPLPGSQTLSLICPAQVILLHGSRGGGKSDAQLMRFRRHVGQGFGKYWRGVIFDREYKSLDDLVSKSTRWFPEFNDGAKFLASKADYRWVWPTGEELLFRVIKKPEDYWGYHGQEFCLAVGEKVLLERGRVPIEEVVVGDRILTPKGYRNVSRVFATSKKPCVETTFRDRLGRVVSSQVTSETHRTLTRLGHFLPLAECDEAIVPLYSKHGNIEPDFAYVHPYTKQIECCEIPLQWATAASTPVGEMDTIDITVDDANCYFSASGVINQNCFIGWNELTKFPSEDLFDMMFSCNRSSFKHDPNDPNSPGEIPLLTFATTNPVGPGHNWIKRRFIQQSPPGAILKKYVNVFNPRTQKREDILKTQTHIFSSYRENRNLAPEYVAELEGITDENKRKAWLFGSWDVISGGMFDSVWRKDTHIVQPFEIPAGWKIDRSFDYGKSKPFSVGWWAESQGGDVLLPNGKLLRTIKGDLFRIAEWYGCEEGKSNKGLNLLATEIAEGIIERELSMGIHARVVPGPADNAIWNVDDGNSIAVNMAKPVYVDGIGMRGVSWVRSDKSKGSRKAGWEKIRQMLSNAIPDPITKTRRLSGLFVFNTCGYFIEQLPVLPRSEDDLDDIDTDCEDHIADEARYRVLNSYMPVKSRTTVGL